MTARHSFASLLSMVLIAVLAAPAMALLLSTNEVEVSAEIDVGPQWYRYGTGTDLVLNPSPADTYVNTQQQPGGDVELVSFIPGASPPNVTAVPWWDTDWQGRQCVTGTASGTHFVDVGFDSMAPGGWAANGWTQADYGDVRAVVWNGTSNTEADFWLATPYDTEDGHAFVTTDFGASGTRTICLYFGHNTGGLTTNSNPQLGRNWATNEPVYEDHGDTNLRVWVSNPTDDPVVVGSYYYLFGFILTFDSITLAPGQTTQYLSRGTTLYSNGSIIVRGTHTSRGEDSLTPIFHPGTTFASRSTRNIEEWCVYGPVGTTVTITPSSGTPAASYTHDPNNPCITHNSTGNTLITTSAPVSMFHVGTNSNDAYPLYPVTTETLYGVPTRNLKVGTTAATTATVRYSNAGADATITVPTAGLNVGGGGTRGAAPAMRITGAAPIAASSQADADGSESTTFIPIEAMASRYVTPVATGYVALACPKVNDTILVNGTPYTCAGTGADGVGHLRLNSTAVGTVIESQSGSAFMVIYEPSTSRDESIMLVPRLNWADVATTSLPLEASGANTGTWTTIASATTDVWGLLEGAATVPAGASVSWEIACAATTAGPFTFDTVALPRPVDHACDDVDVIAVRATLTANGPQSPIVHSATVEHSMPVAGLTDITSAPVVAGTNWLWRVHDNQTTIATHPSGIITKTGTASGDYTVHLLDDNMVDELQVTASGGVATDGGNLVVVNRSTVMVEATTPPTGTDEVVWRTFDTVWAERTLQLTN